MIDVGINICKLDINYHSDDKRRWTIVADPGNKNIVITCFKTSIDDFYFELTTPTRTFRISTLSSDVIIEHIKLTANFTSPSP